MPLRLYSLPAPALGQEPAEALAGGGPFWAGSEGSARPSCACVEGATLDVEGQAQARLWSFALRCSVQLLNPALETAVREYFSSAEEPAAVSRPREREHGGAGPRSCCAAPELGAGRIPAGRARLARAVGSPAGPPR